MLGGKALASEPLEDHLGLRILAERRAIHDIGPGAPRNDRLIQAFAAGIDQLCLASTVSPGAGSRGTS